LDAIFTKRLLENVTFIYVTSEFTFIFVIIMFQGIVLLACSGSEFVFLKLMNLLDSRTGLYLHRTTKQRKTHISMSRVESESTIPMFKRPKTVRASDRSAIGTGIH